LFDLLEERRRQKITRICDIPIVVIEIGRGLKNVIIRSGIRRRNHGRTIRRRNNVPSIVVRNLLDAIISHHWSFPCERSQHISSEVETEHQRLYNVLGFGFNWGILFMEIEEIRKEK
jgi:hypothetical protein